MKEFAQWFKELDKDAQDARRWWNIPDVTDEELRKLILHWRSLPTTYTSTEDVDNRCVCRECKPDW